MDPSLSAGVSSWNRDPATGLIFTQSGPRCDGSTLASGTSGGRDWDAGSGDDRQDPPGVFQPWQVDQSKRSAESYGSRARWFGRSSDRMRWSSGTSAHANLCHGSARGGSSSRRCWRRTRNGPLVEHRVAIFGPCQRQVGQFLAFGNRRADVIDAQAPERAVKPALVIIEGILRRVVREHELQAAENMHG
jgi:hypothetical protein